MWAWAAVALLAAAFLAAWRRTDLELRGWLALFVTRFYVRFWHRMSSNGPAPLPAAGPAILVANHTCSADAAFLGAGCDRLLSYLIADEFSRIPVARRFLAYLGCVPVRRDGRDLVSLRVALRRLEEGRALCIFPEGGLSGVGRGRIGPVEAGVAGLALRSGAPRS